LREEEEEERRRGKRQQVSGKEEEEGKRGKPLPLRPPLSLTLLLSSSFHFLLPHPSTFLSLGPLPPPSH
jgi:hypothetical protein